MSRRLVYFIIAQALLLCAASVFNRTPSELSVATFGSVLAAQFVLIGIWYGVGNRSYQERLALVLVLSIGLSCAALSIAMFNPWELLMCWARLLLAGFFYHRVRRRMGLVVTHPTASEVDSHPAIFRITIFQTLAMTFVFAGVLSLMQNLSDSAPPGYELLLILLVVFIGFCSALAPVAASAAAFSKLEAATSVLAVIVVLLIAAAIGFFNYMGTDSMASAYAGFVATVVESVAVGLSIIAIRTNGYRLVSEDVDTNKKAK